MPHSHHVKILFVCKKNHIYGQKMMATRRSSGLFNSTRFIVESLREQGIRAAIVEVTDNNDIDREVTKHRPDLVVIEALWVVPEKFPILKKHHPRVKWFVHLHSDMPFLALEGNAIDWIVRSAKQGIGILANSFESYEALSILLTGCQLELLPNVYRSEARRAKLDDKVVADIGCFGAVRPLKNHLLQAMAAIRFAREKKRFLRFHINVARVETGGDPVLKNLRSLFQLTQGTELCEHRWFEPDDFLDHLQVKIDLGLQVSLSETFNVVTADYVTAGLPVVVSKEVKWVDPRCWAIDNSVRDIVEKMHTVWHDRELVLHNQALLRQYAHKATSAWVAFVQAH